MEDDLDISVTVEKIATSVTSTDFRDSDYKMTFYLELFKQRLPKALINVDVILNLLEYYDIVDKILAVCCDTTSSNTGVFSGISAILNTPPLLVSPQETLAGSEHISLHGGLD